MPEKYQALYQDFHQIRDDSEEHTLLLSEKTRHFWKNRITRFMLLHCASETELPERSMIMWDMYYPVLSL